MQSKTNSDSQKQNALKVFIEHLEKTVEYVQTQCNAGQVYTHENEKKRI